MKPGTILLEIGNRDPEQYLFFSKSLLLLARDDASGHRTTTATPFFILLHFPWVLADLLLDVLVQYSRRRGGPPPRGRVTIARSPIETPSPHAAMREAARVLQVVPVVEAQHFRPEM